MNKNVLISIEKLSKSFPLYNKPLDVVKEVLFNKIDYDLYWALRDISFEVLEQQRIGIIGRNGAGKSTLLQIICGNLKQTCGTVDIRGKISALMSLVPSWNLEETGIENIKLNLALQGCDPNLIPTLTEEIIDFTELGGFIFRPVKTYSSGMSARLSFAIATVIIPEILIIDEVLGVGDGYFVNKATNRVKELCDRGKALLFVSHSTAAVRSMCNKVIWLDNGSIRLIGDVDYVISQYEEDLIKAQEQTVREGNIKRLKQYNQYAHLDDVSQDNSLCQFRIREANEDRILGCHYVRKISFSSEGDTEWADISLFHANILHSGVQSALELNSSEWGRLYTRKGETCRILSAKSFERGGGYFLIKRPTRFIDVEWPSRISLEVSELEKNPPLAVEFLNMQTLMWEQMNFEGIKRLDNGWKSISFAQVIPRNRPTEESQMILEHLKKVKRSPVELIKMNILKAGQEISAIKEKDPFTLRVHIRSHEETSTISVNINVTRADGVYVFFQPSGIDQNIENFVGDAFVDFEFNENPFGAGDYEVSVFVCNGWRWDNIPPSDIFDRSIGAFRFSVIPNRAIPFGLINILVPVNIALLGTNTEENHA